MKSKQEEGFSLIELLLVVVIIGIVAAVSIPAYQKGIQAAENKSVFAILRSINSTQVMHYTQKNRFGRLNEIQPMMGNAIGTSLPDKVVRGRYVFEMSPLVPTDAELSKGFVITATRTLSNDVVYKYEVTQSGRISRILPAVNPGDDSDAF